MFYLFTNLEFGVEFRRVLSGLVRHKLLQATIILSGKTRHRPSSDLRSRWDGVRRAIFIARHDRQLALLWGLPVRTVENINSDRFLARIASSDHGFVAGFNQIFRPVRAKGGANHSARLDARAVGLFQSSAGLKPGPTFQRFLVDPNVGLGFSRAMSETDRPPQHPTRRE